MDCLQSRSVPAKISTSRQNNALEVCLMSELVIANLFLLISPLLYRTLRRWSRLFEISNNRIFQHHLFGLLSSDKLFFHMSRRCSHLLKHLHIFPRWCSFGQKSLWSFFSILVTMIHFYVWQRYDNRRTHGVV